MDLRGRWWPGRVARVCSGVRGGMEVRSRLGLTAVRWAIVDADAATFVTALSPDVAVGHACFRRGPDAPNRSQHRIPSTNQHPISMGTKSGMSLSACQVVWSSETRAFWSQMMSKLPYHLMAHQYSSLMLASQAWFWLPTPAPEPACVPAAVPSSSTCRRCRRR